MKISLGNATYNHKPDKNDMVWHSGFLNCRKQPIDCPVLEDTAENYAFAYDNGLCVKGYMFKSEKDIWKRTFICDFDNLTEGQYNKVIELVKTCGLKTIQGRQSSGMKMDCYLHEGIPDWKPSKWKYKVFFPLDEFYGNDGVMCVREEVEKAYLDVVQFFNNWSPRENTEEIARKWLKANNQSRFYKHGTKKGLQRNNHPALTIEDPIFKDWILPDPVEVTNPRHQITYAVIPEQKEAYKYLKDEDWQRVMKKPLVVRFPTSTKAHFTEIVNLPYDFKDELEGQAEKSINKMEIKTDEIDECIKMVKRSLKTSDDIQPSIPTSRSKMAIAAKKNEWEDLVFDTNGAARTNRAIYTDWEHGYDMDKIRSTIKDTVKFLVRCEAEFELGVNGEPKREIVINRVVNDIPFYVSSIFGKTFTQTMDEKNLKTFTTTIAKTILKECHSFRVWRLEQKCLSMMEQNEELKSKWKEARKQLSQTRNFKDYYTIKDELMEKVISTAREKKFPFKYVRRGLKKEMVEKALNEGTPMSMEMFVDFTIEQATKQDGLIEEDKVMKWYRYYQSKFNKNQKILKGDAIYEKLEGYVLKNGKVRKSSKARDKYAEMFKNKTSEQILDIIAKLDVSRARKSQLRREWNVK